LVRLFVNGAQQATLFRSQVPQFGDVGEVCCDKRPFIRHDSALSFVQYAGRQHTLLNTHGLLLKNKALF
jgi:hypothetical protein